MHLWMYFPAARWLSVTISLSGDGKWKTADQIRHKNLAAYIISWFSNSEVLVTDNQVQNPL